MWISVKKELPKDCKEVMIYTDKGNIAIAAIYPIIEKIDHPYWLSRIGHTPVEIEYEYGRVTHWMPLPEPPKEGE